MARKLPDIKIRLNDALRDAIEAEVEKRREENLEGDSVSAVVRDAIRLYFSEKLKTKGAKKQNTTHRRTAA